MPARRGLLRDDPSNSKGDSAAKSCIHDGVESETEEIGGEPGG